MVEMKEVIFSIDGESAVGPDEFTERFFTFAWDVIAEDVYKAVLNLFCRAEQPQSIFATTIVLIPKIPCPEDFTRYHPISLCNFINKVIFHILSDRLAHLLSKIISPRKVALLKGVRSRTTFS